MFVTAGHVELSANSLYWLWQSEPTLPVRLFAFDNFSFNAFRTSPFLSVHLCYCPRVKHPAEASFGERAFVKLVSDRTQIIAREVHTSLLSAAVLLLDTDVIVLKPFTKRRISSRATRRLSMMALQSQLGMGSIVA